MFMSLSSTIQVGTIRKSIRLLTLKPVASSEFFIIIEFMVPLAELIVVDLLPLEFFIVLTAELHPNKHRFELYTPLFAPHIFFSYTFLLLRTKKADHTDPFPASARAGRPRRQRLKTLKSSTRCLRKLEVPRAC